MVQKTAGQMAGSLWKTGNIINSSFAPQNLSQRRRGAENKIWRSCLKTWSFVHPEFWNRILQFIQAAVGEYQIALIVYDPENEVIVKWQTSMSRWQ